MHSDRSSQSNVEVITAFFAGTGMNYPSKLAGYVSQENIEQALGKKAGTFTKYDRVDSNPSGLNNSDEADNLAFEMLHEHLSSHQREHNYGFDGCHTRGGGLNAMGVKEPAEYLFKALQTKANADKNKKFRYILTGHSRGCISPTLFMLMVNADPILRDRVEFITDFRDFVPGNLNVGLAATGGLTGINPATVSYKLKDLTHCTNVKKAYVTLMEAGVENSQIMPILGFDPLISLFPPTTRLEVESVPGTHELQEMPREMAKILPPIQINKSNRWHAAYYQMHPTIYQLGIYKSLQIYAENGVDLNNSLLTLKEMHEQALSDLEATKKSWAENPLVKVGLDEAISAQNAAITAVKEVIEASQKKVAQGQSTSDDFITFLKKQRVALSNSILNTYKENLKEIQVNQRMLQFRQGVYGPVNAINEATHLNMVHANLQQELDKKPEHWLLKPIQSVRTYLGFKGNRKELKDTLQDTRDSAKAIEHYLRLDLVKDPAAFLQLGEDGVQSAMDSVAQEFFGRQSNHHIPSERNPAFARPRRVALGSAQLQKYDLTQFAGAKELNELCRQMINYYITHAYDIYEAELEKYRVELNQLLPQPRSVRERELSDEIAYRFVSQLRALIDYMLLKGLEAGIAPNALWANDDETSAQQKDKKEEIGIGGGQAVTVPSRIANIYRVCLTMQREHHKDHTGSHKDFNEVAAGVELKLAASQQKSKFGVRIFGGSSPKIPSELEARKAKYDAFKKHQATLFARSVEAPHHRVV